ncbi:SRPBCC domain-containing protein [Pararhodobacter zhoushanensis]|uniref:SRPBCC domain-containing protein n=1 Tax=Pararhodobacter zhoushanensis TaxID=2479545 RepID=A0ABT3GT17_9RHOB|nr:SRPBCC domain-containing protein [Pararhodobacter zhoushanensis]MCW1930700.1 SRPBCC domain-containing protein [Pararhodobacter zhoushanensis]
MSTQFDTLVFERDIAASPGAVWHAWIDPAARAAWSAPSPAVTVEYLSADARVGGEEISLCKVKGQPDIRCDIRWLAMDPGLRSVNSEVIAQEGTTLSTALVTAELRGMGEGCVLTLTVQLASLAEDMGVGYQQGFGAGLDNLTDVAQRVLSIERVIDAPVAALWEAWTDPEALPLWWGPDGFSCRTQRIDLRKGGEWVFDMVGPDGTVYPNHHRYTRHIPQTRIDYTLHWGENGPKHADASARFEPMGKRTKVTLDMLMATQDDYDQAKAMGAMELGLQTLGKLARQVGA